jgi:hypothetical protein
VKHLVYHVGATMPAMASFSHNGRPRAAALALEAAAARAGCALACTYSSAAEFDAALIAARRAAGVYGPKRQRRQMLLTAAGVAAALAVLILLVV